MASLTDWQRASGNATLLQRIASLGEPAPADIARLRRDYEQGEVAAAIELIAARRRAGEKFGDRAARLIADREGVEMATSLAVGAHKARRFVDAGMREVADLCSGIGGDAMALSDGGLAVRAFDLDPVRAWMTAQNAGCGTECADVTARSFDGAAVHIDPARRTARGRSWRLSELTPPIDAIERITRASSGAGVKLGPGLPREEGWAGELEFISEGGRLTNAVLWTGALDSGSARRATALPTGDTIAGPPDAPPIGALDTWLHTIDPSVERAQLLGALCARVGATMPHPQVGLITSGAPLDSPWLRPYELVEHTPWRERRVRDWLRAHDGGGVTIKTRGKAVDPDPLHRRLKGEGSTDYVVFVLRVGERVNAYITRPRAR